MSVGGKEVLIKAVIQAIPSYMMSCFLLLVNLYRVIESMISRFWWGQKNEEYKIHWVSWSKMCAAKKNEGVRFRDIHCFNLAILAKQY